MSGCGNDEGEVGGAATDAHVNFSHSVGVKGGDGGDGDADDVGVGFGVC